MYVCCTLKKKTGQSSYFSLFKVTLKKNKTFLSNYLLYLNDFEKAVRHFEACCSPNVQPLFFFFCL